MKSPIIAGHIRMQSVWTLEQVKSEIEKNDSAIFANIGVMPVTYCYPYNYKTDEIVALASKNRVGTRTKQISIGGKSTLNDLPNGWMI